MSTSATETCIKVIDTELSLCALLEDVTSLPTKPPSLYCNLEGSDLGRRGSISILTLFVVPRNTAYLVDVHRLGKAAFTITNNNKVSLKTILESSAIPKVFFDVRNDSDALLNLCQVSLRGVKDVQLMELGCRPKPESAKKYLAGLAECVAQSSAFSDALKKHDNDTARLFDTQKRGAGEHLFNRRPLGGEIEQYRARNVIVLPGLHNVYDMKLRLPNERFWQVQVQQATKDRIKLSQTLHYEAQDRSETLGPWSEGEIEEAVEQWNEDVLFNAMHEDEREDWDEDFLQDWDWDCDDCDETDDYPDDTNSQDCIGWEEDMLKNGETF